MFVGTKRSYNKLLTKRSRLDIWFVLCLCLLPVVSSLHLISSDLTNGLSAEMLLSAETMGIVRTPGMAVYLITAKLFSWIIPWGNVFWKYGFISLLFSTLTSFIIYITGRRLQFPPYVSLVTSLTLFLSPFLWENAVIPHHLSFNLFLLSLGILLTIRLLTPANKPLSTLQLVIWSMVCGLTSSQHIAFIPWGIALFILGNSIGLPRHRGRGYHYLITIGVFIFTAFLPLLYGPIRITDSHAFFNSDYVYQYATLSRHLSWSRMFAWFVWYTTGGHHPVFWFQSYSISMIAIWDQIWLFVKNYPFFPLTIMVLGLLSNIKSVFIQQPHPAGKAIDTTGRLMTALLPLIAIGGSVMMLADIKIPITLGLTLGGTYWSFKGLEYCYYKLGQPSEVISKVKKIKPQVFGLMIISFMPLFSFVHTHLSLSKQIRHDGQPASNIMQAGHLLKQLPPNAVLIFPDTSSSFLFDYFKRHHPSSAGLTIIPFSYHWNDHPYTGPSLLKVFSNNTNQSSSHQLQYMEYWSKNISRLLSEERPVYMLAHHQPPDVLFDYFIQSFDLKEACSPITLWYNHHQKKHLYVYRVKQLTSQETSRYYKSRVDHLASFNGQLAVKSFVLNEPIIRKEGLPLLHASIAWHILDTIDDDLLYIQFKIVPDGKSKFIRMLNGKKHLWQTVRRLSKHHVLSLIKKRSQFQEDYQLAIPADLAPGHYTVHLSVINPKTKDRLLLDGTPEDKETYFSPVSEFWIKAGEEPAGTGP